ncbi:MAG: hypothetical protein JWO15_2150 [Sphingomonadales bacterium]|nr:hypothetical protein [Sphingomonadales bacterium]
MKNCPDIARYAIETEVDVTTRSLSVGRIESDQTFLVPTSLLSARQLLTLVGAGGAFWAAIALVIWTF